MSVFRAMELKPLLEKRRRTVKEITGQMKQTSWKVFFGSFVIYLFSFIISLGIMSFIFGLFNARLIWLQIVLALVLASVIAKKIVHYIEKVKKEKPDEEGITYKE